MISLAEMCRSKNAWEKWREEWQQETPDRLASRLTLLAIAGLIVGLPVAAVFTGDPRAIGAAALLSVWMFSTLWTERTDTSTFWDRMLRVVSRGGFVALGLWLSYLAFGTFAGW
jgi:hypothetical protein